MPVVLDPSAARIVQLFREAGRPALDTLSPPQAREAYLMGRAVTQPDPPEMSEIKSLTLPGPAGPIPLRVYTPHGLRAQDALAPGLVFFHGGGWVIGDLESHDIVCRTLAIAAARVVVAVDYRLAPEHKFPAAIDDAIAATEWIAANAMQLGIDANRIVVGGDSAGGNLAAVVAIHARDHGPRLAGQMLIYPVTDLAMSHPSHSEPETSVLLTHNVMRWFRDHYARDEADYADWRGSPLRADDLSGLPPAIVVTAGADPLRDEGDAYAKKLEAAGVAVTHRQWPGQFHGFFTMGRVIPEATALIGDLAEWLKKLG
jgi:acetyl esterase